MNGGVGRAKRIVLGVLIAVAALLLPFACIALLFLVNTVNPMQLAFITSFSVENQSGEPIVFTPVGTYGREGKKSLLPLFTSEDPAIPSLKDRAFGLGPGQSATILYDWDDINLSEIAVRTRDGRYYQLAVDPRPTERQYHEPEKDRFAIPPIGNLDRIEPEVLAAVRGPTQLQRMYFMIALGILAPVALACLLYIWKKGKRALPSRAA